MPDAPPAAAPTAAPITPAAAVPPAAAATPQAAPPASPAAPVAPLAPLRKVYKTQSTPLVTPPAATAETVAAPESAPVAAGVSPPPVATGADSGAAATEEPSPSTPAPEAEKTITDGEAAKRLARLHRAEAKHAAEKQAFAAERAKHAEAMQRVQFIEQGAATAKANPLEFMRRAFGIEPQHVLDSIIAEGAKTPQQKTGDEVSQLRQTLADYQRQIQEAAEAQKRESQNAQVRGYISGTIAPIVADAEAYKFARHRHGESLAERIYEVQAERFRTHGQAPSPKEVADYIESTYRKEAAEAARLLGANVAAKQVASPNGTEPPIASKVGSQTRTPQSFAPLRGGRPYVSRPHRG